MCSSLVDNDIVIDIHLGNPLLAYNARSTQSCTMPFQYNFDIEIDMNKRRYNIPSSSSLMAFESAARLCNFSRAAEELHTSQSAISRHIADLETRLGARLFDREKKRLHLTPYGEHFYRAVVSGLESIQSAATAIAIWSAGEQVTIACTHEISHLYLMPRFDALQMAVGEDTPIRIMTYEYDALEATLDPRIDLMFTYQAAKTEPGKPCADFSRSD